MKLGKSLLSDIFDLPFLWFLEDLWLDELSIDEVDELDEVEEFAEGDEREDMADERLVGETEDFFWWSFLWLWPRDASWLVSVPRSWLDGALARFKSPKTSS